MKFVAHKSKADWWPVLKHALWDNQAAALEVIEKYLDSDSTRQALVRMPTGSGKTPVIAVLAQLAADYRRVLVVAPWDQLVTQLAGQLAEGFWTKAKLTGTFATKPVLAFTPSSLPSRLKRLQDGGVLVCTTATLEALHREEGAGVYSRLQKWAEMILVDEGHREPAPKWAQAIRALDRKTVLFTATPYRNDAHLFEFDHDFAYAYTFTEAVADGIIRDVEITEGAWPRHKKEEYAQFVGIVRRERERVINGLGLKPADVRVVVRAEKREEVRRLTQMLQENNESAIGIHEGFTKKEGPGLFKKVPKPEEEKADYWVHQHKLTEGLDDPRFRVLALFRGFVNGRSLVQQVGRIIRNPGHGKGEKAYVVAHQQDGQKEFWLGFIDYEAAIAQRLAKGGAEVSALELFREAREAARTFYFKGNFRILLRADAVEDPRPYVQMRPSVIVGQPLQRIPFRRLVDQIEDEIVANDGIFFGRGWRDANTYLRLYETAEPSGIVNELYLESRLAYVCVAVRRGYVFFTDSTEALPEVVSHMMPVAAEELGRMLPEGETTIGEVSVVNGDLGSGSYRRKTMSAPSLADIPPALSDYHHICTTALGRVDVGSDEVRRYVGFTRGRLTERVARRIGFHGFLRWIDATVRTLTDKRIEGVDSLGRFATPVEYDGKQKVTHLLLDLEFHGLDLTSWIVKGKCTGVSNLWQVEPTKGEFQGELDGWLFKGSIVWDAVSWSFKLASEDLGKIEMDDPESGRSTTVLDYLNHMQNFRALLGPRGSLIYTQRGFFTPNAQPWLGGRRRFDLIRIVASAGMLDTARTEKGREHEPVWPDSSVFGALVNFVRRDSVFRAARWIPDILFCNDVGNPELADFVAIGLEPRRIVQIHAKVAKDGSAMSASAFYALCSQAIRYLAFFNPHEAVTKVAAASIATPWQGEGGSRDRIVHNEPGKTADQIATLIDEWIRDPSCEREVWLVMGQGLSKKRLAQAMSAGAVPRINEIHMVYLLQSTWSQIREGGASMRVFCRT